MVTYLQAIILGVIQGITEWLPISSSGHLVIAQKLFNLEPSISLILVLHIASLIVIFLVFYRDIYKLIKFDSFHRKLSLFIIIGTIPIALIGYFFSDLITNAFTNTKIVGYGFLITFSLLYFSKFEKSRNLNIFHSILIGISQALALLPGVSRSGSTISTGMILGVNRQQAVKFSFLLAIPALLGAFIHQYSTISFSLELLVGFLVSILVGYISLKFLLKIINSNKLHYFSYYCLILGLLLLFYN